MAPACTAGPKRSDAALIVGLTVLASVLPLIVTTRWYDHYYWPKVQVLYAVLLILTPIALWTDRARWLRNLRSPVGIALAVWLALVAVSTALSVNPLLSVVGEDYRYEGLLTWLAYGAVVAGVAGTFTAPGRIRLLLAATYAAAGVMAALGLLQQFGWTPVPEDVTRIGWARAWGTTGSPLALGAYLVLLLPLLISLYTGADVGRRRWIWGGLGVLMCAALAATGSRAAWGGSVLGIAAWGVASGRERLAVAARPLILLGVACALAMFTVLRISPPAVSGHTASVKPVEQRMVLWTTVAPLVLKRPLLGWGPETLAEIYPAYKSPVFLRAFPEAAMQSIYVDRPHNDLLQQAVAMGLAGLAAYLWLWATIFASAWRAARGAVHRDRTTGLAAGLLGAFVAYFVQLQFSFSYVSVAPVFWSFVGLALVLDRNTRDRSLSGGTGLRAGTAAGSETDVRAVYG